MTQSIIFQSGILSLAIQIITGLFDIYVVFLETPVYMQVLKQVLWLEIVVQFIEGGFYVWLIRNFHKIENITRYRYWDWIITTPTMLISFTVYLYYLKTREGAAHSDTIANIMYDNASLFTAILGLNTLMLAFGYLAELGRIPYKLAAILGFVPFVAYFYLIYDAFAKYTDFGRQIFWVFSGIWALYGVASVMSYRVKNVMYNILDLFAKNFFGIFIAGLLYFEHV